jgi:hypothetical protein
MGNVIVALSLSSLSFQVVCIQVCFGTYLFMLFPGYCCGLFYLSFLLCVYGVCMSHCPCWLCCYCDVVVALQVSIDQSRGGVNVWSVHAWSMWDGGVLSCSRVGGGF